MKYDELDDRAKARARDTWRVGVCQDGWWDFIYDDAVACAKALGIEIGTHSSKINNGKLYTKPDIWFSGFYTQGSGSCFSGGLHLKDLQGAIERVKAHAPQDEELKSLAILADSIWQQATAKVVEQRLAPEHDPDSVEHLNMDAWLTINGKDRYWSTKIDNFDDSDVFLEDDLNNLVEGFAGWIYSQLEAESDYRHSDECVAEDIMGNDMEYDEEGCEV